MKSQLFSLSIALISLIGTYGAKITPKPSPYEMECTGGSISEIETWIKDETLIGITIKCPQSSKTFGTADTSLISQVSSGGKYINAEARAGGGLVDLWISDRIAKDGSAASSTRNMGVDKVAAVLNPTGKFVQQITITYQNDKKVSLPIIN